MSTPDRMTLAQARTLFGVTSMTLYLWRQGTASKAALPTEKPRAKLGEPATAILFDPAKVEKWAAKHDVPLATTVAKALKGEAPKPGPKPRNTPVARKVAKKPAAKKVARKAALDEPVPA